MGRRDIAEEYKAAAAEFAEQKKITCRVRDTVHAWLSSHFRAHTHGAEYVLNSFPVLYRRVLHEARARFGAPELEVLIDVCKGLVLYPSMAGNHLLAAVIDGVRLDKIDRRHKVDGEALIEKLRGLSQAEVYCLEIWGGRDEGND